MNRAGPRGALILLVLSLVWFAAMLWSAQANITGTGTAQGALIQLSDALPVVVAASVLAGTAAGLAALGWRPVRAALRWPVAMGAGATPAAVAAVLIIWGYGSRSAILLIATAVLVAGTLGGALGAVRPGGGSCRSRNGPRSSCAPPTCWPGRGGTHSTRRRCWGSPSRYSRRRSTRRAN